MSKPPVSLVSLPWPMFEERQKDCFGIVWLQLLPAFSYLNSRFLSETCRFCECYLLRWLQAAAYEGGFCV
jgi:hypothetical protein